MVTPYYHTHNYQPQTFGLSAQATANERADILADYGMAESEMYKDTNGRIIGDTPYGQSFVYNTSNDNWNYVGDWQGGYKKIKKCTKSSKKCTKRSKKCTKSSKKCRRSYKKMAKRSRRNRMSR